MSVYGALTAIQIFTFTSDCWVGSVIAVLTPSPPHNFNHASCRKAGQGVKYCKGLALSGIVAFPLLWDSNAPAILIYNMITFDGTIGQIGFEGFSDSYVGTADAIQESNFNKWRNLA
jgi:hypothetical protein